MARVDRGLAVDWVSPDSVSIPAAMRFPGEILHVYDGGTWTDEKIASVRLPDSEITGIELVEPARLPALMSPSVARRALSALRARINAAGAVLLENGAPIAPPSSTTAKSCAPHALSAAAPSTRARTHRAGQYAAGRDGCSRRTAASSSSSSPIPGTPASPPAPSSPGKTTL
ncbi:hypothetical protein [Streptomyces hirsutus]|uniref:hypothetical protein n=1 Tax=Streptomyces hirsutus TaxID=35620 RepID=UPI0033187A1D